MYPSDGTVIAKSPEDSCGGMSSVWKSASLEGKWEALDWQTERNWRPFMWSVVKYSTWARVFHWISVRVRSVCAHFPIYAFIMESRSFVKIWKFLDEKKIHLLVQMRPAVARCLSQTQKVTGIELVQIHLLWFSKLQQLITRTWENFRCCLSLKKELKKIWAFPLE